MTVRNLAHQLALHQQLDVHLIVFGLMRFGSLLDSFPNVAVGGGGDGAPEPQHLAALNRLDGWVVLEETDTEAPYRLPSENADRVFTLRPCERDGTQALDRCVAWLSALQIRCRQPPEPIAC